MERISEGAKHLNGFQLYVTIGLSFMGVLVIPALTIMIRGAIKWTRVEDRLDRVIDDLRRIIEDKDKVHQEITRQISDDRRATDRRLRWLEEHVWRNDKHTQ